MGKTEEEKKQNAITFTNHTSSPKKQAPTKLKFPNTISAIPPPMEPIINVATEKSSIHENNKNTNINITSNIINTISE